MLIDCLAKYTILLPKHIFYDQIHTKTHQNNQKQQVQLMKMYTLCDLTPTNILITLPEQSNLKQLP